MSDAAVEHHLSEALRARQAGRTGEARRHFEAALALEPDQPLARYTLKRVQVDVTARAVTMSRYGEL